MAVRAHDGQKRKNEDLPYIAHPVTVALMLAHYSFSDEVIAAGAVHDVLEDTRVASAELRRELGDAVADIVEALSEDKTLAWEERKQQYVTRVAAGPEEVWAVSIADKIQNLDDLLASLEREGDVVWERFNAGKEQKLRFEEDLLAVFKERWAHPLVAEYESRVQRLQELM